MRIRFTLHGRPAMPLNDNDRATLDSIGMRLASLAEQHLMDEIDEASYAFNMNELLATVPTP